MSNQIDPLRHMKVFNPAEFGNTRIDIVGCGATGSRIALSLAKLGVECLHIWDFDTIAEHNIANQAFELSDVGRPKVEALADLIQRHTGLEPVQHNERVTASTQLGQVVFVLTDTMASRKEIWNGAIKFRPRIELMVETRMGASEGRVYTICPMSCDDTVFWEGTLCADEEASDSLCGARISVGPTAEFISAHAVWAFIRWVAHKRSPRTVEAPDAEAILYLDPPMVVTRKAEVRIPISLI